MKYAIPLYSDKRIVVTCNCSSILKICFSFLLSILGNLGFFTGLNGISPKLTSIISILVIAILAICTLHMIMDKKPAKKK